MLLALLFAATVLGRADVESLAAGADVVVYGQVVRRSSAWAPGGGQIFTTVVLRPIETWKGASSGEIAVLVPGGEVGELSQTVQGAAVFNDAEEVDRKSTRLNSSHVRISYAVFCLKKKRRRQQQHCYAKPRWCDGFICRVARHTELRLPVEYVNF